MSKYQYLKSINYCLLATIIFVNLIACQPEPVLYKRVFSEAEKFKIADQLNTNKIRSYGQGSVGQMMTLKEAIQLSPQRAELYREVGVPYGKRGMAVEFDPPYSKAVELDPLNWQGYRGYMYLYFYRDYERAIADFKALDALTPNFVDYPQATSVYFMEAVAYLMLEEYDTALSLFDQHITEELRTTTEDFIDLKTFVFQGIAHYKKGDLALAKQSFDRGTNNTPYSADLWYWTAKLAQETGDKTTALAAIEKAKIQFDKEYFNNRPYVEEFFQIYELDITELKAKILEM